jgi:hypothetical protein
MARKVFQDFVNVLCHRFVEGPTSKDLVVLALGGGELVLDILGRKSTCNRYPVVPIPYADLALTWIEQEMRKHAIPAAELTGVSLLIEYSVSVTRRDREPYPIAAFDFTCNGQIASPDRNYTSVLKAQKTWGLMLS